MRGPPPACLPRAPRPPRAAPGLLLAGLALASSGCNRYALFNQAGYEQASFSDDADILFVVDNSCSMAEEGSALASNFGTFIDQLTSAEGATPATETLEDAVGNYITYTQERGKFIDYQLAITTPTAGDRDNDGILLPGEGGTLIGDDPVFAKSDPDIESRFRQTLLCETVYFQNPPIGGTGEITDCSGPPTDGVVTQEYLDCVCGGDTWRDTVSGFGTEEQVEAALMALCRTVEDPPPTCFEQPSVFDALPEPKNAPWLRDESTVVVVIVTDEGDESRRTTGGQEELAEYVEAFEQFDRTIKFATIGPWQDPETGNVCGDGVPTWGVQRLINISQGSGGFYNYINEPGAGSDCVNTDFSVHLRDLGDLLVNLVTAFQLQSVPDVTTIRVWIDGEEVPEATLIDGEVGTPEAIYDQGWSYDPSQNAVVFWGGFIPDYNADVEIFYRPLSGKPRDLPF